MIVRAPRGVAGRRSVTVKLTLVRPGEGHPTLIERSITLDAAHRAIALIVRNGQIVDDTTPVPTAESARARRLDDARPARDRLRSRRDRGDGLLRRNASNHGVRKASDPRQDGRSVGPLAVSGGYGVDVKSLREAFDRGVNYWYHGSFRKPAMTQAVREIVREQKREQLVLVLQSYTRWACVFVREVTAARAAQIGH